MRPSSTTKIDRITFERSLSAICLNRGSVGLPRKQRDLQILLKSIVLTLDPQTEYSEKEFNDAILDWLERVGCHIESDPVTLRRWLVDERYVSRDAGGQVYVANPQNNSRLFEPEVDKVNPLKVIQIGIAKRIERRKRFASSHQDSKNHG